MWKVGRVVGSRGNGVVEIAVEICGVRLAFHSQMNSLLNPLQEWLRLRLWLVIFSKSNKMFISHLKQPGLGSDCDLDTITEQFVPDVGRLLFLSIDLSAGGLAVLHLAYLFVYRVHDHRR